MDNSKEQPMDKNAKLLAALGVGEAWPITDVLMKLIESTEYLLDVKNYDRQGWEEVSYCTKVGRKMVSDILVALKDSTTMSQIKQLQPIQLPEPTCNKCGEKINKVNTPTDFIIKDYGNDNLHVCDPLKVEAYRKDWDKFISDTRKMQHEALKSKEIDIDQCKIKFNI